jgi:hypothetical protein
MFTIGVFAPTMKVTLLRFLLSVGLIWAADANAFRGSRGGFVAAVGSMSTEELRAAVLEEVTSAFGSSNRFTLQRLKTIEDVLQPTFRALPKNSLGNLDHGSAHYFLHRVFVQRHGMYIKGLEPGGETWSSNGSATEILEDRVPAFVQSLFEERLQGRGLDLHELAVLVSTLEHLIQDEAVERLMVAYQAHGFSLEDRLDDELLQEVLETYMMIFIKGRNVTEMSADQVAKDRAAIERGYPGWKDTKKFAYQVRASLMATHAAEPDFAGSKVSFSGASKVVEEIGEQYGRWQDAECRDLKSELLKLEDSGRGRVLLKDFYGQALTASAWQFTESVDYLRELGALDESTPQAPSVIIPNYVNSLSNCLASSSLYSVCCINECEGLLGHLEREIGAPQSTVQVITQIVSSLPSSTVTAPRTLSPDLIGRLQDVADHHGGSVPLHGRLFAQWLHHAYPRECPYPHTAGSTNPLTADEWIQEKGVKSTTASKQEMQLHVQQPVDAKQSTGAGHDSNTPQTNLPSDLTSATAAASLPWVLEEELLVVKPAPQAKSSDDTVASSFVRGAVFLVAAISLSSGLRRHISQLHSTLAGSSKGDEVLPFTRKQHAC